MEEEGGDDSEMIDAMEGWDSDQDDGASTSNTGNATNSEAAVGGAQNSAKGSGSAGVDGA